MRKKRIQESAAPTGPTARAGATAVKLDELLAGGRTPEFLDALRHLTRAHGGVATVAARAGLSRPGLYRSLSPAGNPELGTITAVLKVMGLRFSVSAISGDAAEHKAGNFTSQSRPQISSAPARVRASRDLHSRKHPRQAHAMVPRVPPPSEPASTLGSRAR